MPDFEKLGVFYLGREYNLATRQPGQDLLLYDAKDLVTHAVCVGMTGSGKTGLCLALLEEALLDGIPVIAIDPKGDLGNLLLTFPELRASDFRPWINEEDARRKGLSPEDYAAQQAKLWSEGLAKWGQDGERIRRLRDAAELALYTPGSSAGLPVSILESFAAPEPAIASDPELLAERVGATVTGLLGLLGIEADPLQSREHIFLSTLLGTAWREGRDLDLAGLIQAIQTPPVARIGVFDLESFYPSKERFALAMRVNNLLAAPGFATWLEGEPLDIDRLLFTAEGKPRAAILSIAHLSDAERMFFVTLLLTQLLGWMRRQPGTTSLRAVFYMDEIFGYFPPVANPPSKPPLLTLVKQARAFGLGIVLATQNPVDLDYKGLSNTGTWLIGRLQTERDKERVLDGLEGAAAGAGGRFDRAKMGETLAGLGQRIFLMNNVHDDAPVVFESRWAMSYLRGPLTREQVRSLMEGRVRAQAIPEGEPAASIAAGPAREAAAPTRGAGRQAPVGAQPILAPEIAQLFLPAEAIGRPAAGDSSTPGGAAAAGAASAYRPWLLGEASLFYSNARLGVAVQQAIRLALPLGAPGAGEIAAGAGGPDWSRALDLSAGTPAPTPVPPDERLPFAELPPEAARPRSYAVWSKAFKDWLYQNRPLTLLRSPSLGLVSSPGESERDFRIRLQQSGREHRDAQVAKLRTKYAARIGALEDRIRRAEYAVQREKEQADQQKLQAAISLGATILTAFGGRRAVSRSTLGRATTSARGAGRVMKEQQDIQRAAQNVTALRVQLASMQAQIEAEAARMHAAADALNETLERLEIRPRKTDIVVGRLALAWKAE